MPKRLLQTRTSLTANKNMVSRQNIRKKEHIIVKGVTHMISDATMNGIYYPESEVKALANAIGTDRVTMPASHPVGENGEFISASDPWALTSNFIGAYAFNFSMQGDKLISDVAIDPLFASTSDDGKTIMNAIENGTPIDMSTGFYLNVEEKEGVGKDGEPFEMVASNLHIDHSAFLPNEIGAKNKTEGVGLHTNSAMLDGVSIDTDVALLNVNASTPAMKLPLAPENHTWNESQALANIKAFTNSTDKPSTSYRKFFLNFDQDDVDNFASYTNLFADVIDGVPHAVKSQVANVDGDHAKSYVNRFDSETSNNKQSFVKKVLNKVFSLIQGNELSHNDVHEKIYSKLNEGRSDPCNNLWPLDVFDDHFVYRDDGDKLYMQSYSKAGDDITFIDDKVEVEREIEYKPIINNNGDRIMRDKILAALTAANIKTDGLDDDALFAAHNELLAQGGKDESTASSEALTKQITDAVTNAVKPLQDQINANSDKELTKAQADVVAINKGIDEDMAKVMTLESCNKFLASNGHVAVGVTGGQHQTNAKDNCASLSLPTSAEA